MLGGFLLYAIGAAAAARAGIAINWTAYLLGQVVVTFIQLMAHYLNEYYDMDVDRLGADNRTWFSGGSGILSKSSVSPSVVLSSGRLCAGAALLTGVLASIISPWMIPIVIISLLGAWYYSSPPLSLMSSGWGELTTSIIVPLLVPLTGCVMQGALPSHELWLVCLPLILVHFAMLISFEFPDRATDLAVSKKTLTVRLGLQNTARLASGLMGLAYLFLVVILLYSKFPVLWMAVTVPLAVWQMVMLHRVIQSPTRARFHILTTGGLGLFVLLAFLAFLGFFINV